LNGGPPSSFVEPDVASLNFNRLDGWMRGFLPADLLVPMEGRIFNIQQHSKWRTPKLGLVVDDLVLNSSVAPKLTDRPQSLLKSLRFAG